mmetsp:Transcript_7457/g.11299  ORF Transcript_7457/g.11299 Transcript_7457/m.11299 type:complete len:437 (-) Transcript_7457:196-1506(-)
MEPWAYSDPIKAIFAAFFFTFDLLFIFCGTAERQDAIRKSIQFLSALSCLVYIIFIIGHHGVVYSNWILNLTAITAYTAILCCVSTLIGFKVAIARLTILSYKARNHYSSVTVKRCLGCICLGFLLIFLLSFSLTAWFNLMKYESIRLAGCTLAVTVFASIVLTYVWHMRTILEKNDRQRFELKVESRSVRGTDPTITNRVQSRTSEDAKMDKKMDRCDNVLSIPYLKKSSLEQIGEAVTEKKEKSATLQESGSVQSTVSTPYANKNLLRLEGNKTENRISFTLTLTSARINVPENQTEGSINTSTGSKLEIKKNQELNVPIRENSSSSKYIRSEAVKALDTFIIFGAFVGIILLPVCAFLTIELAKSDEKYSERYRKGSEKYSVLEEVSNVVMLILLSFTTYYSYEKIDIYKSCCNKARVWHKTRSERKTRLARR